MFYNIDTCLYTIVTKSSTLKTLSCSPCDECDDGFVPVCAECDECDVGETKSWFKCDARDAKTSSKSSLSFGGPGRCT